MPMARLLSENRMFAFLKKYGYKTVAFESGHTPTQVETADHYFSPGLTLSEFQNILLNTTPIPFLFGGKKSQFDLHRARIRFILDRVSDLSDLPSPKIVFAHMISPHPPFVFGEDGREIARHWPFSYADGDHYTIQGGTRQEYIEGYRGQAKYLSGQLLKMVDQIIENSEVPPIIILQGDHGPGSQLSWESVQRTDLFERFCILNAYYLPGLKRNGVYPSITPVNSFRLVLNRYFGTDHSMLMDRSYYTTRARPYQFYDVTDFIEIDRPE
jgi:hypothetical protein